MSKVICPLCNKEMHLFDHKEVDVGVDHYYECDCSIIGIREVRRGSSETLIRFTDSNGNDITLKNCVDILHANVCADAKLKFLKQQNYIYQKENYILANLRSFAARICVLDSKTEKEEYFSKTIIELNLLLNLQYEKLKLFKKIGIDKL